MERGKVTPVLAIGGILSPPNLVLILLIGILIFVRRFPLDSPWRPII
jgi:hypothetical protein